MDLTMENFSRQRLVGGPSLHLNDLLPGSSSTLPNVPYQLAGLSDKEKSLMFDIAKNAMQELVLLWQTNDPVWMKSNSDGRYIYIYIYIYIYS